MQVSDPQCWAAWRGATQHGRHNPREHRGQGGLDPGYMPCMWRSPELGQLQHRKRQGKDDERKAGRKGKGGAEERKFIAIWRGTYL